MEDDLIILKVEYLSNHWSNLPKTVNLSSRDKPKKKMKMKENSEEIKNAWKEDDLQILKVEYLSNHWSDLLQFLKWSSEDQIKIQDALTKDNLW